MAQELRLVTFALALADSHAEVDLDAPAYLLDGDTILLQDAIDSFDPSIELEPRLRMAVVVAATERTLARRLQCVEEVYGQHLRRLTSVTHYQYELLFGGVAPILTQSQDLLTRLEGTIATWDPDESCLGPLFVAELWEQYEEYLDQYQEAARVLREKHNNDEEFVALCKLRRGAAKHSLPHLLHLPRKCLASIDLGSALDIFKPRVVNTWPGYTTNGLHAPEVNVIVVRMRRGSQRHIACKPYFTRDLEEFH
ncbi:uncharacterized protein LOC121858477 [Homarus americanus]|uniref:uncharacterized protein LOC121858477 n=1 Tax=Homarus americanus TaxID=6706 RepID=UPI001C45581F|nr:uncharacterized protein LOC121858477 [Homarus americanus]